MKYYVIQNNGLLISDNEFALSRFYNDYPVYTLPEDYEEDKYIVEEGELVLNPEWETEQTQKERERVARLSLTKREVFLALYKDKGVTPEQIKQQLGGSAVQQFGSEFDIKSALIEFEYANDYFRGNPLIDLIGQSLGYTSEELDYLFEHKELPPKEEDYEQL